MSSGECAGLPAFEAGVDGLIVPCPASAEAVCCSLKPAVDSNPPMPAGWRLMPQSDVTKNMTAWAVDMLHDVARFALFDFSVSRFEGDSWSAPGELALDVLARVEWHPPDFNNAAVHRGVTLYVPIDGVLG